MNKVIYKYELQAQTVVQCPSPIRKVVHVAEQEDATSKLPYVWVQLWSDIMDDPQPRYRFTIVGTGESRDDEYVGEHVGTFLSGPFVWHVHMKRIARWLQGQAGRVAPTRHALDSAVVV